WREFASDESAVTDRKRGDRREFETVSIGIPHLHRTAAMLRFERDRPTNFATVLKVILGGVVAAVLLAAVVQEVVLKSELDSFEPTRTTIGLSPGAAEFYYDPEAVDPDKNRPDPREGLAPPTTDLLEGLPDH